MQQESGNPDRPLYDIECDWTLLWTCNYRCSYCFYGEPVLGKKLAVRASPATWREALAETGHTWLLHITGGEPSIYPGFVNLCEEITGNHLISLNTNLSNPSMMEFARRIRPERVNFINAGFHMTERHRRQGAATFVSHAKALRDAGFPIIVSVVATPRVVEMLPILTRYFSRNGLHLAPKVLRGWFAGRPYPRGYLPEQKSILREYIAVARARYDELIVDPPAGPPSIDIFNDDQLLDGEPSFRGRPCSAGVRFVSMDPEGNVFRCSARTPLGNLLDGGFRLLETPQSCNTQYCVYFCQKYTNDALAQSNRSIGSRNATPSETADIDRDEFRRGHHGTRDGYLHPSADAE